MEVLAVAEKHPTLREQTLVIVADTLRRHNGNRTYAALELDISIRALRMWIEKYDQLSEFRRAK